MATATQTHFGSTQQFKVVYPGPSVSSDLTTERESPQKARLWSSLFPGSPNPMYDYYHPISAPHVAAKNYFAWYTSLGQWNRNADQARSLGSNDWSPLISELTRISKFGDNWDGEGAEHVSEESVKTALSLINIAQDVKREVADQNEPFKWRISPFCEPEISTSLTTQGSIASILTYSPEQEPSTATELIRDAWNAILARISTESVPGLYPTVEGGVTLKWIHRGKELQCTALGDTVEVIRWKSADSYDSDGLWDLNVEETREHFEWLMR